MNTRQVKNAQVDRPDVLLSLAANGFGTLLILTAGVRGVPLGVGADVPFRGDLWRKRGDDPYSVRVVEGVGSWTRLGSAFGLDWHDSEGS